MVFHEFSLVPKAEFMAIIWTEVILQEYEHFERFINLGKNILKCTNFQALHDLEVASFLMFVPLDSGSSINFAKHETG